MRRLFLRLLVLCLALGTHGSWGPVEAAEPNGRTPPVTLDLPLVSLRGVKTRIGVEANGFIPVPSTPVTVLDASGRTLASGTLSVGEKASLEIEIERGEGLSVVLPELDGVALPFELRVLPRWASLLPPLVAILLALLTRQVVLALFAGVWLGASLAFGGGLVGALRAVDHYVIEALTDSAHASILVFSLLLGGMVGVMARSGATHGLVEALTPFATDSRRGQLVTWVLGLLVFFDDYANTLLVGNTMRPVTDRLKISREKLAYIVDSTAAPVASIGIISTWIGYEVSLIGDALTAAGSEQDAYALFLRSIPYNFYPILTLAFGLIVALSRRDFGPMLGSERRAWRGQPLADTAVPLADFDNDMLQPVEGKPRRWLNAVVPVGAVLVVTFVGLYATGRQALLADGDPLGSTPLTRLGVRGIGSVFSAGDSLQALLWGSSIGCAIAILLAVTQRVLRVGEALGAWLQGMKSMTMAFLILVLAWSIAAVCVDLNTSGFMVAMLSNLLDPRVLPATIFLLSAVTAFATGTSWGTMGILIPIAVPTVFGVAEAAGLDSATFQGILLGAVSAVLAGAIFGDHCSPISDTTVLSSMASGCDHVDHVKTQLPYAVLVALVALLLGYLPEAFGVPPWVCLLAGTGALLAVLRVFGRTSAQA